MSMLNDINSRLKATDIKGKPYIDVAQRIQGYWELYPMGRIVTTMLSDNAERCVFKATVYDDDGQPIANGHAFETKKGMVNSTSYIENCETSAVGRALGMLGIGSTESIASADEVQHAIEQQEGRQEPPKGRGPFARLSELKAEALSLGIKEEGIQEHISATYGKPLPEFGSDELHALEAYLETLINDKRTLDESATG